MTRRFATMTTAERDAMRHLLLAGVPPREVAPLFRLSSNRRATIRLRKPAASCAEVRS